MPQKSLSAKMFLKANQRLAIVGPPKDWRELLGDLPCEIVKPGDGDSKVDVVILFVRNGIELRSMLSKAKARLLRGGMLWLVYIKGTSSQKSDINRDSIREYAAGEKLETVAAISINEDWSGLRLKMI